MLSSKDKITIFMSAVALVLLIIALTCSFIFAAFTANCTATTTVKFHNGVSFTVNGVQNETWKYKINNTGNFGTTGSPLTQLDLSPISITQTSGSNSNIRVFIFLSSNKKVTLPDFDTCINTTTGLTQDKSFSNNENSFINGKKFANGQSVSYAANGSIKANASKVLINQIKIFETTIQNDFNGAKIRAYVRIYASTDTFSQSNKSSWNNTYFDFSFGA